MDFEVAKSWFTQWTEKRIRNCRLLGSLGLLLAPVALASATFCIYWLLRLFMHDASGNLGQPKKCFWISLAIIPGLFIGNRFSPRRDLMEEQLSEGRSVRRKVLPLVFLWFLFTGPRLFDWAFRSFNKARLLQATDTHSCAAVLWLLVSRPGKVSFDEMQKQFDWLKLDPVLADLNRVPGVLFLKAPPAGLSLTQEFRDHVRSAIAR